MRICCLQHVSFEGPGAIAEWATERGHDLIVVSPGGELPASSAFDMLVVLGGPMGANDEAGNPCLAAEKALIAHVVADGALVLGICLGAQLLASALGGRVFRAAEPEIGWFPVSLTAAGNGAYVFRGWPPSFVAGHWHGDVFDPPAGVTIAAVSEACMRQAFATSDGRAVGLQFHLEWTEHSLRRLIDDCAEDLVPAAHVQTADQLTGHPELLAQTRELLFVLLDRMEALP